MLVGEPRQRPVAIGECLGPDAVERHGQIDRKAGGCDQKRAGLCSVQDVVEEPVPGRGLLGWAVVAVGQLHRVRPEQFVEADAARPWLGQQVRAGQLC